MGEDSIDKEKLRLLIELGRFRFLYAGFFLYLFGSLLAIVSGAGLNITYFAFGYAIMLPAHLSLSYSNNYFDIEVDKHNEPVSIAGGSKTLIDNHELIPICKYIAIFLIILSISLAAIFVILFSFPIYFLLFIIFGNLLGWFYTAPPLRLAYRGLGEIANMINMGLLMPGIGYLMMKGNLDLFFFVFALPLSIYGLEFMIIVETPDMEGDKKAEKNTLLTKIGRKLSYKLIIICLLFSSVYFLIISYLNLYSSSINYSIVYMFSLLPLFVAIYGWFKEPFTKNIATKIAKNNMSALISFVILVNIYLLLISFS